MENKSKRQAKKFYVVFKGVKPGIYLTWEDYAVNVLSFPRSMYKIYKNEEWAIEQYFAYFNGKKNNYLESYDYVESSFSSVADESRKEKNKFYVVFRGNRPGVYSSRAECASQVLGYGRSVLRSFRTEEEARSKFSAFNDRMMIDCGSSNFSSGATKASDLSPGDNQQNRLTLGCNVKLFVGFVFWIVLLKVLEVLSK